MSVALYTAMENENERNRAEAKAPELAQEAVMVKSVPVPEGTPIVKGFDFNSGRDLDGIMAAAMTTGFQVRAYSYIYWRAERMTFTFVGA